MVDSSPIYKPPFRHEALTRYQPGGYHPVSLGDTFQNGRYQIHHKLRWDAVSTTWLAKEKRRQKWVSIKIATADHTKTSRELEHLRFLATHFEKIPGSEYIIHLLNDFVHQGPNGNHQCLVFEMFGPSVAHIVEEYFENDDNLEPNTILRMSKQLLQGIEFLHQVDFVHGNIDYGTLVFDCKRFSWWSKKRLFKLMGRPEWVKLIGGDGKPLSHAPSQLIMEAMWEDWDYEDEENIRIIGFGQAFQGVTKGEISFPSNLIHAPENIFTKSIDYRFDLWQAGCTIYSFITGGYPFMWSWMWLKDPEAVISEMIEVLGELPMKWEQQWEEMQARSSLKDDLSESSASLSSSSRMTLEILLTRATHDDRLKPLPLVIQNLMKLDPENRIEASRALDLISHERAP